MSAVLKSKKFAFVLPRFVEGVAGGAETLAASIGAQLAQRGDQVSILTTCAQDNRSWENSLSSGLSHYLGMEIRRFKVDPRNLDRWVPLQIRLSDGLRLSLEEQYEWLEHGVNSGDLYQFLAQHAVDYDAIFYAPYWCGTTFWGSLIHPQNSVLIPCLHNEAFAYLDTIGSMFRQVRGCLFNAAPEQDLAQSLFGNLPGAEVGMGFDLLEDNEISNLSAYFDKEFPYILYLGRKETGKNVQLLVDNFVRLKQSLPALSDLKLVIAGGGSFSDILRDSAKLRDDVVDVEHLSELDKKRLVKHALVLCQPSVNESFSIVIMEAWRLGTPVLVHGSCLVTRDHAIKSGGGLYFTDADEFMAVVERLYQDKDLRSQLARSGREYVRTTYAWPAVLKRFDDALQIIFAAEQETAHEISSKENASSQVNLPGLQ